jgi:hypothetical protein
MPRLSLFYTGIRKKLRKFNAFVAALENAPKKKKKTPMVCINREKSRHRVVMIIDLRDK